MLTTERPSASEVPTPPLRRRRDLSTIGRQLLPLAVLVIVAGLVLLPLVQLEIRAFGSPIATFRKARRLPNIGDTIRNTVVLGIASLAIAVTIGTMLARSIAQLPSRARKVCSLIPYLPIVIPTPAYIVGWVFLLTPRQGYINQLLRKTPIYNHLQTGPLDVYSLPMIALITGLALVPFVYAFMYSSMLQTSGQYEAAAATCGASRLRRFFTVVLPLQRPALVYSTGICFLLGIGQFAVPLLLGRKKGINVLTTEMYNVRQRFPIDYALAAMLGFPLIVLGLIVVITQRRAIGNEQRFAVQGGEATQLTIDKVRWVTVPVVLFGVVAVLLPVLSVIHVAFQPYWTGEMTLQGMTTETLRSVLGRPQVYEAVRTSLTLSAIGVAILLPLAFACAMASMRRSRVISPIRQSLDVLVTLPLGIPAVIFGLGVLFAYTRAPFNLYGSKAVIVIVYVTITLPFATRLILATLQSMGPSYAEASAMSGAGSLRTLARILVPLARNGLASAAALVIVLLFHEFSASVMVRGARTHTMGTLLNEYWEFGDLPAVAVLSLVMIVSTLACVSIALALGGRGMRERR